MVKSNIYEFLVNEEKKETNKMNTHKRPSEEVELINKINSVTSIDILLDIMQNVDWLLIQANTLEDVRKWKKVTDIVSDRMLEIS